MATDSLKKGLALRSDRIDLANRMPCPGFSESNAHRCTGNALADSSRSTHLGNILSPNATIAPALESSRRELERHMRRDSLEKALQNRPKQESLIKEGILADD